MSGLIMTPDHPDFYMVLHFKLPPGSTVQTYAPDADTGILKPLNPNEEQDFCYGGEMDEVEEKYLIE